MHALALVMFHSPQIVLPEGSTPHIQLILRWIHFGAGITWVGLLYFFVLINAKFLPALDASTRMKVVPALMPLTLWWFRWSSVVTVLAGIWYWMMIVSADAHNAQTSGGHAVGAFVGLWTPGFAVGKALLLGALGNLRQGARFGVVVGLVVRVAGLR